MTLQTLKIADIVERTSIDRWTAQYVLKHPDALPGMPKAGSQGVHRVFSIEQALRLAICTELVKGGLALEAAGKAVVNCEKRFRDWGKGENRKKQMFKGSINNPWIIEVLDHEYVLLRKSGKLKRSDYHLTIDIYYSVSKGRWASEDPDIREAKTRYEVNVTFIRHLLTASA